MKYFNCLYDFFLFPILLEACSTIIWVLVPVISSGTGSSITETLGRLRATLLPTEVRNSQPHLWHFIVTTLILFFFLTQAWLFSQSPYERTKAFVGFFLTVVLICPVLTECVCYANLGVSQVPSKPLQLAALLILNKRLRIGTLPPLNSVIELSTILEIAGASVNTEQLSLFLGVVENIK